MKKTLIILILISFSYTSYSQVNRYSKPAQVAKYTPIDNSILISYSQQQAKKKAEYIYNSAINLNNKVERYLIGGGEPILIKDLDGVKTYLRPLLSGESGISVSTASWYLKKAKKKYNKAIKQYNKRYKKLWRN